MTFDSNILIYTLSRDDPRHADAALLLARATRSDWVQTLQSLAECFRVLTTKLLRAAPSQTGDGRLSHRVPGLRRRR